MKIGIVNRLWSYAAGSIQMSLMSIDFTTLRIFYLFADCFNLNLTTVDEFADLRSK